MVLLTNVNEKSLELICSIEGLRSQCLNLQLKRKFNETFWGWQQGQGVKILRRFNDWLRPKLQGVANGLAEPKLSAREHCVEFCCLEIFESYNEKICLAHAWIKWRGWGIIQLSVRNFCDQPPLSNVPSFKRQIER